MIAPGATIGILGGGQLGRMLALAAAAMGYRVHIFAPEEELPAGDVSAFVTRAGYKDKKALDAFAASVDVITYEFENVPVESVAYLAERAIVRPGARALEVAQDRLHEKQFIEQLGGTPAPYRVVDDLAALEKAIAELGTPAILKTRRMGYDGKGQVRIQSPDQAAEAWAAMKGAPSILEGFVTFAAEFSVILARDPNGACLLYPVPQNIHEKGILDLSLIPPAEIITPHIAAATQLAQRVAEALDHIGVITLEFFATAQGPVFNEMAPRVHNSGHWTIEGCKTSQFENHIRAVCGIPMGATALTAQVVRMQNLLGDAVHDWQKLLADPRAHVHLYGKSEVKAGRKMGHVTWC